VSAAVNTVGKSNSDRIPSLVDVRKPPITHHPCVCVVELGGAMVTFSTLVHPFPQIYVLLLWNIRATVFPAILGPYPQNPHPQLLSSTPVPIALVLTSLPESRALANHTVADASTRGRYRVFPDDGKGGI